MKLVLRHVIMIIIIKKYSKYNKVQPSVFIGWCWRAGGGSAEAALFSKHAYEPLAVLCLETMTRLTALLSPWENGKLWNHQRLKHVDITLKSLQKQISRFTGLLVSHWTPIPLLEPTHHADLRPHSLTCFMGGLHPQSCGFTPSFIFFVFIKSVMLQIPGGWS